MDSIRRILATDAILFTRVITSIAALAVAFGLPITDIDVNNAVELTATLLSMANLAFALLERRAVFSRNTHDADVSAAYAQGVAVGASPNRQTF